MIDEHSEPKGPATPAWIYVVVNEAGEVCATVPSNEGEQPALDWIKWFETRTAENGKYCGPLRLFSFEPAAEFGFDVTWERPR